MRSASPAFVMSLALTSWLGCGRDLLTADTGETDDDVGEDASTGTSESSTEATSTSTSDDTSTDVTSTSADDTSSSTGTDTSTSDDTSSTSDTSTSTDTSTSSDTSTTDTTGDPLPCADVCGTPGCGSCPDIAQIQAQGYQIDATEVRVSDYLEFASLEFDPAVLAPVCTWKVDFGWFVPEAWDFQQMGDPDLPVVGVDWCDAESFCRWTGRRLCGQIGGGSEDFAAPADPNGEWFAACSDGNTQNYPYGNGYQALACNGDDLGAGAIVPVASLPACEGGLPDLFDMSGNVWEWSDACLPDPGLNDYEQECRRRGGSWVSTGTLLRCSVDSTRIRSFRANNTGIRCCAD